MFGPLPLTPPARGGEKEVPSLPFAGQGQGGGESLSQ